MAIENPSRRQLLRGQFLQSLHSESAKIQGINAIRPPWSCVLVCEQPIFRSLEEEPWAHKVEITTQCLTENRVECRSCQDSCPMNAIRFRLQLGGVAKPILDLESCNGCGACLSVCPTKAIKILNFETNTDESI